MTEMRPTSEHTLSQTDGDGVNAVVVIRVKLIGEGLTQRIATSESMRLGPLLSHCTMTIEMDNRRCYVLRYRR